jgi:quinate dehydrogenase (quinone)
VLADIRGQGDEKIPALIAPTKRGELFLLDRRTGKPIAEVEERPVPQTDVPGEWTSKTQPFSVGMPAFGREPLTEAKMWGITPLDQMLCRIKFRESRYEGPLTPPTLHGTIQSPGFGGGMNWGSVSVDEAHGVMITNALQLSNWMRLYPRSEVTEQTDVGYGGGFQHGTPYAAFTAPFMSPLAAPCEQPPYGEIAAIDLNTRKLLWRRPLGTANEMGPLGLKLHLPIPMGVPYSGGTIVTRGGLVFMGGTMDRRLRALDISTGKELWSAVLPNNAEATPMSYVSPVTHRQFVVIAVPGTEEETAQSTHVVQPEAQAHASSTTPEKPASSRNGGGWIIAYSLPPDDEL